jgi:hypothetical protein
MKNKFIKLLICGLLITLSILSIFTNNLYSKNKQLKVQQNLHNQIKQEQTFKVIDKSVIIDTLNKQNKLVCLDGNTTVEAMFTNENVSSQDVNFRWIKDKISKIQSKSVKVQADISFDFTYDLANLPVSIHNNTVEITINPNKLNLNKCQFIENKNIYNEDIGILSKRFSAQEINSINERVKAMASNQLRSQEDLREKSLENVKSDIYALIKPLLGKDVNLVFIDYSFDVIQQSDVSIIN